MRVLQVQVVAGDLEHAGAFEEARGDRAAGRRLRTHDALLDVHHQDLVQLRHRLGRPVVAVHQHLAAALALGGLVAEAVGHRGLQVEDQAVLAAAGHHVQPGADQPQRAFVLVELAHLERRHQALGRELAPGAAQARGARDPDHHLQVAQAAGAFLAVGFQRVRRALVLHVALLHLQRLRAQEGAGVHRLQAGVAEGREDAARAADQPRFEQRRLHGDVARGLFQALVDGAHRRADLQPDVPAGGDEAFDRGLHRVGLLAALQQHQHVDVAVRKQLAAAVAAHRHQRRAGRHAGVVPQRGQRGVDVPGQRAQQLVGRGGGGAAFAEVRDQRLLAVTEAGTQRGHAARRARGRLGGGGHGLRWPRRPAPWRRRSRPARTPAAAGCRPTP